MSNKEHLHNIETNVGTVTIIQTVRKNRPTDLRKPYEYKVPATKCQKLLKELSDFLKPLENRFFQYAGAWYSPCKYGIRFNLFLMGYSKGLCGPNDKRAGVTPTNWKKTCNFVQNKLFKYLGKDARMYHEPYSTTDKFQARFETYIAYSELL